MVDRCKESSRHLKPNARVARAEATEFFHRVYKTKDGFLAPKAAYSSLNRTFVLCANVLPLINVTRMNSKRGVRIVQDIDINYVETGT